MFDLSNHPFLMFAVTLPLFWVSARIGIALRGNQQSAKEDGYEDFFFLVGAVLTLLSLMIGFSFSMAVSRYDQRKTFEEEEANAIGTEYVRAEALPAADTARVRALLKSYLEQRILYYEARDEQVLRQINAQTARLQTELWSAVVKPVVAQQSPVMAQVFSGMNGVLNSQGYTQSAWWNRIPGPAWTLLISISIFCNLLIGYGVRLKKRIFFLILPTALSISLFLIADIDSPRKGIIHVRPQNLESLAESLRSQ